MDLLVDIIIPVYNKEKTIARCLESVLNQTYTNFNVIIVDDGSTDHSYDLCLAFQDKRINIIKQTNMGVGEARNVGLKNTIGDKFVFVDADDYVSPMYLSDLLKYEDEKCELIVQGYYSCLEDNSICEKKMPSQRCVNKLEFEKYIFNIDNFRYLTMPWNKLFDTKIVKDNNLLFRNINLGEDVCFVFDYLQYVNNVLFVEDANYFYIESKGSLTRTDIPDVWERQKDINSYCRKDFYPLYEKTWTNMYIRAAKRTLGEATKKKDKFVSQIMKVRSDDDFNKIKIINVTGIINKIIYLLFRFKFTKTLFFLFTFFVK